MIKTLSFSVTGQRIEIVEPALLVAGTVNIYNASFSFDADWDGFQRTAVFSVDGVSREQLLTDDACTLPWEVLTAGKYLRVGVYGTKGEKRLPTIWTEHALYISSGAGPTDEAAEPSPTLLEQLLNKIGSLDSLKTEDKASLVAAINEVWASGGGGSGGTTDHNKLTNRDADDQHPMSAITGLVKALAGKQPSGDYLTQETDPTVPAWAKAEEKPSYTAPEVGADPSGTAAAQVAAHNTGTDTHSDIRLLISGLTDRINALADSDDTTLDQLSEVVAYIKSNRTLIEAITTSKVSVSDIIDNLTTNASNKPLSAAQGVALKALIDAITVPDKLPNPNALTFTGAVTGTYDGSAPLEVAIPSGGSTKEWTKLIDTTFDAETAINIGSMPDVTEMLFLYAAPYTPDAAVSSAINSGAFNALIYYVALTNTTFGTTGVFYAKKVGNSAVVCCVVSNTSDTTPVISTTIRANTTPAVFKADNATDNPLWLTALPAGTIVRLYVR